MRFISLLMALLISGCSQVERPGESESALARELAGRSAGEPRNCISTIADQSIRAVDSGTLIAEAQGVLWVNRLRSTCSGVRAQNTLIFERTSGDLCRGDRVRGLEPSSSIPGPSCLLQDWVPYPRR